MLDIHNAASFAAGSSIVAFGASPLLWKAIDRSVESANQKTRDSVWRALTHSCTLVIGAHVCSRNAWVVRPDLLWTGWPHHEHEHGVVILYAVFCGFTIGSLPEVRRSAEFWTMAGHHALTLALVLASFVTGFCRAGAVLMLVNDFVDVWFEAAKLCRYRGKPEASRRFLYVFVFSWAILREWATLRIILSASRQGKEVLGAERRNVWEFFMAALWCLWALHTYWFVFLVRKALRA